MCWIIAAPYSALLPLFSPLCTDYAMTLDASFLLLRSVLLAFPSYYWFNFSCDPNFLTKQKHSVQFPSY